MITREAARGVADALRAVPGVTRVLVARADGVPLYDDVALGARESAAAAAATALGVSTIVADALALGAREGLAVFGEAGMVAVRPLADGHALAAICEPGADIADVYRRLRRHGRELDAATAV